MKLASHRRTKTALFLLYERSKAVKLIETVITVVAEGWGQEEVGSFCSTGIKF